MSKPLADRLKKGIPVILKRDIAEVVFFPNRPVRLLDRFPNLNQFHYYFFPKGTEGVIDGVLEDDIWYKGDEIKKGTCYRVAIEVTVGGISSKWNIGIHVKNGKRIPLRIKQ